MKSMENSLNDSFTNSVAGLWDVLSFLLQKYLSSFRWCRARKKERIIFFHSHSMHRRKSFYRIERLLSQLGPPIVLDCRPWPFTSYIDTKFHYYSTAAASWVMVLRYAFQLMNRKCSVLLSSHTVMSACSKANEIFNRTWRFNTSFISNAKYFSR